MDAIGVTAVGFHQVVASCGTSLTTQQVQAMRRHTQRIVVNFDPDAPGANAAERSINLLLEEGMQVRIMELDGGLDPDEYCKQRGAEAYRERLEHAQGYFYWLADRARAKVDIHSSEGKVAMLKYLMPALQKITDRMERVTVAGDVASYVGIDRGMILDSFKKAVANRQEPKFDRPTVMLRHDERMLLSALLTDAGIRAGLISELRPLETISTFQTRRLFQTIFSLDEAGARVSFEDVHARLEEADQALLAQAVLTDDAETTQDEILAAVQSLRRSEDQNRCAQWKMQIKEAERAGNVQEALRLTQELQGFEQAARARR
jgi:DNA primase